MTPLSSAGTVVDCHSGHAYPERPRAFEWEGQRLEIVEIAAEWRTPQGKHFRVVTEPGQKFELVYDFAKDSWKILPGS